MRGSTVFAASLATFSASASPIQTRHFSGSDNLAQSLNTLTISLGILMDDLSAAPAVSSVPVGVTVPTTVAPTNLAERQPPQGSGADSGVGGGVGGGAGPGGALIPRQAVVPSGLGSLLGSTLGGKVSGTSSGTGGGASQPSPFTGLGNLLGSALGGKGTSTVTSGLLRRQLEGVSAIIGTVTSLLSGSSDVTGRQVDASSALTSILTSLVDEASGVAGQYSGTSGIAAVQPSSCGAITSFANAGQATFSTAQAKSKDLTSLISGGGITTLIPDLITSILDILTSLTAGASTTCPASTVPLANLKKTATAALCEYAPTNKAC